MNEKQFIAFFITFLLLILWISLYQLQIKQGEHFKEIAENNYVRIQRIMPTRGTILDSEFTPLVNNKPSNNLFFIPAKIKDKKKLSEFLQNSEIVDIQNLEDMIYENRFRSHREIIIKEGLTFAEITLIGENTDKFPSLLIKPQSVRQYISSNHFTGYVGRINNEEYQERKDDNYSRNDIIGKAGLEKKYENLLRGKVGYLVKQVDANGKNLNLLKHHLQKPAVDGADLVLTINNRLQNFATEIMNRHSKGALIVMDTKTGGILSYVSLPTYDQNLFIRGFSKAEWDSLTNDPKHPMLDRVIHATYPPASVFKTVTLAEGLQEKVITPEERLQECTGGMQIGNRFFRCWLDSGHGSLNAVQALKYSCDVYFYDLSLRLDLDNMKEFVEKIYLSQPTGIDLLNERRGFFPNTAWYKKNYGRFAGIIGPKANISIGQGELLFTPLQIICHYNAIANDGVWKQPFLLKQIISDELDYSIPEKSIKKLPITEENIEVLQEGLRQVVQGRWGTGKSARVKGIKVWGKTGSAENHMGDLTHAWFSGYAGIDEPEITFTIFFENVGHGGSIAAPIAQEIISFYFHKIKGIKSE